MTCQHFKKANEWLELKYGEGIDWDLNVKPQAQEEPSLPAALPAPASAPQPAEEEEEEDEFGSEAPVSAEEEALLAAAEAEATAAAQNDVDMDEDAATPKPDATEEEVVEEQPIDPIDTAKLFRDEEVEQIEVFTA